MAQFPRSARVVQQLADRARQGGWVGRRDQPARISHHFGQGAAGGAHHRDGTGHRLSGRQPEPFVDRGDHRQARPRVLAHEFRGVDPAGELDVPADAERAHECLHRAIFARGADHHQPNVVSAAQDVGHGVQEVREALEGYVGAVGDDDAAGLPVDARDRPEQIRVDPVRHHAQVCGRDAEFPVNIPAGALGYGDDRGERARHPFLHADERVPAPLLELFPESGFGAHGRAAVDGDGVVDRGEGRHPAAERPHPVGEALVVVQDVNVRRPVLQEPERTQAEREGFGESPWCRPPPIP